MGAAVWSQGDHTAWEWTPAQFYADISNWVKASHAVVCEGFVIAGPRAKASNMTIEMIGVLRYLCLKYGVEFVVQPPGAYRFAGAAKLKHLGWYTAGSDHARSASGHLVLYLAKNGHLDPSLLLPSSDPEEGLA